MAFLENPSFAAHSSHSLSYEKPLPFGGCHSSLPCWRYPSVLVLKKALQGVFLDVLKVGVNWSAVNLDERRWPLVLVTLIQCSHQHFCGYIHIIE